MNDPDERRTETAITVMEADGYTWIEIGSLIAGLEDYLASYKKRSCGDPFMDETLNIGAEMHVGSVIQMLRAMMAASSGHKMPGISVFDIPDDLRGLAEQ
jgi:hypothetical protein